MPWKSNDFLEKGGEGEQKFKIKFPGIKIIIGILIFFWILSGIYIVNPDEVGVVKRFGAFNRITLPGPHYHLPYPIETVITPKVTEVKRVEIGFRPYVLEDRTIYKKVPKESLMLTGDENFVDVQFIVQYQIKNPKDYLFNIKDPRKTVKDAAEAAMREIVGKNRIDAVLTAKKLQIQNSAKKLLQNILDKYQSGIKVIAVKLLDVHPPKEVLDAFKDVASAREDKNKLINQALAYKNEILPKARGIAAAIINQAEAYKEVKIKEAQGETLRFLKILKEYQKAKNITEKRLYLELMEELFESSKNKIILSEEVGKRLIPYLPLNITAKSLKKLEKVEKKKTKKVSSKKGK